MKDTFATLFYLKTKISKDESAPIYVRITVRGQRAEISLKIIVERKRWNINKGRLNGTGDQVRMTNHFLSRVHQKIQEAYYYLIQNDLTVTARAIKNKYLGVSEVRKGLLELIHYHNSKLDELIGIEYKKSTVIKYNTTYKHLKSFIVKHFRTEDVCLVDLQKSFISDFAYYLKTDLKIGVNTSNKYLMHLKKIVKDAVYQDLIPSSPFEFFKLKNKPVIKEFLKSHEVDALIYTDIKDQGVDLVRDVFVFCCHTGLAYVDIKQLTHDNLTIGIDGNTWLQIYREKTHTPSLVPLSEHAKQMVHKYKNHPKAVSRNLVFPVHSNQKMNVNLKKVAKLCGIEKNLSMHVARHTFATETMTKDVPLITVSHMMGHSSTKTTQIYAKLVNTKIASDMINYLEKASSLRKKIS
ncbi:MAG: site-specific integrase [Candidatus Marinimicrobia bacterium]|nr:site-specific integrase [Candidatus Neomarinimicrobiota bacterium]